jgi:hypothetical protein
MNQLASMSKQINQQQNSDPDESLVCKVFRSPPPISPAAFDCHIKPFRFHRSISLPETITSMQDYHACKRITRKSTSDDHLKTILKVVSSCTSCCCGGTNPHFTGCKKNVRFDPKIDRWHNGLGIDFIPKASRVQES